MRKQVSGLAVVLLMLIPIHSSQGKYDSGRQEHDGLYREFEQLVQDKQEAKAIAAGQSLFEQLVSRYPENDSLRDLRRRLQVAEDIAAVICEGLGAKQKKAFAGMLGPDLVPELPPLAANEAETDSLLAPAEQLYWMYLEPFSHPLVIEDVSATESRFLQDYYHLNMRNWTKKVAAVVTQLISANPESSDPCYYSLVLPLLYLREEDPTWNEPDFPLALLHPDNLDAISDFCLLRVDRPAVAFAVAQREATLRAKDLPAIDWALAAGAQCAKNHRPDLAEKLLTAAIDTLRDKSKVIELRLQIAKWYGECGDNATAAGQCQQIVRDLPNSMLQGKVAASYFAYLARQSKAEQILTEIDPKLKSPSCRRYLPQLMYLKWWALRKTRQQALAAQIGKQLIEDHGNSPCVAPVLLAHATDALSNQRFVRCRELLTHLTRSFPQTDSAKQAQLILNRLSDE